MLHEPENIKTPRDGWRKLLRWAVYAALFGGGIFLVELGIATLTGLL